MTTHRGTLFLIVGPSGAGKDSLLDGARAALAPLGRHVFARRVITRPADAGGEDHSAVSEAEFARLEMEEAFALSWRANGLGYGIARGIESDLAAGRHVVANVSRLVVPQAREAFQPLRVIAVTAPTDVIAARLAARGRESAAEVAARLARGGAVALPQGADVAVLVNDGDLKSGIAAMVDLLAAPATV